MWDWASEEASGVDTVFCEMASSPAARSHQGMHSQHQKSGLAWHLNRAQLVLGGRHVCQEELLHLHQSATVTQGVVVLRTSAVWLNADFCFACSRNQELNSRMFLNDECFLIAAKSEAWLGLPHTQAALKHLTGQSASSEVKHARLFECKLFLNLKHHLFFYQHLL